MSAPGGGDRENPGRPGWYPDPWSTTGTGERYFDGKRWGTSERPLGRNTVDLDVARRSRRRARRRSSVTGRFGPWLRPIGLVVVLVAASLGLSHLLHHDKSGSQSIALPSASIAPAAPLDRPPPSKEEAAAPIGKPAALPPGPGKYEVLADQPDAPSVPVAFDPCRPIHYVVNATGAPVDGPALLHDAIARLGKATGFEFINDGATTEAPTKNRVPYQPKRYGADRWAPVLVAWSDEAHYPELAGYVAGIGGPTPVYTTADREVYVSGQVVLDRAQLSPAAIPVRAEAEAVILHELGHLVGLDHTADRTQLMFSEAEFNVRTYGHGDLLGLATLGTQACFPGV